MARRGVRAHFDVAVAMVTVIPLLCVVSLAVPDIRAVLGAAGRALVIGIGLILSPGLGYTILARYPMAIVKLKNHLGDILEGEIPDQVDLISDEADVAAVEYAVNIVLERLRERVEKVSAVNTQLQDELLQSRKLEAVGTLAYGVAHEIATPLQILRSNLQFVCEVALELSPVAESPLAAELKACVGQAENAAEDISATLSALRDFAPHGRKPKSQTPTDLNETIRHTVALSRNEWKYVANVDLDLDDSLPSVLCAAGEIKQVLVNLTLNAAQAIRVRNEAAGIRGKGSIGFRTRSVAEGACVEVSDSGCGIPVETVPRVFDPFLSTDGDGLHHGRGLSLAYATVVHDHGGRMTCQSAQGQGTTITFLIPSKQKETDDELTPDYR
jgi:signal transduction histidine kinase